jgi:hypothetical protein
MLRQKITATITLPLLFEIYVTLIVAFAREDPFGNTNPLDHPSP